MRNESLLPRSLDKVQHFSPDLQAVVVMAAHLDPNDASPIRRLGAAAFDALADRFEASGIVFAEKMLHQRIGRTDEGDEIANWSLFRLHRGALCKLSYNPSLGSIWGFYCAILRREVVSYIRKKRPEPVGDDLLLQIGASTFDAFVDREEMLHVINMLPEPEREVLFFISEGYSAEEISDVTGLSTRKVYRRTYKARARFRQIWEERKGRQDDVAWLEALIDRDEALRVIGQLSAQDQRLLGYVLNGHNIDEISKAIRQPKEEVYRRVFAAKGRFSERWHNRGRQENPPQ